MSLRMLPLWPCRQGAGLSGEVGEPWAQRSRSRGHHRALQLPELWGGQVRPDRAPHPLVTAALNCTPGEGPFQWLGVHAQAPPALPRAGLCTRPSRGAPGQSPAALPQAGHVALGEVHVCACVHTVGVSGRGRWWVCERVPAPVFPALK